MLFRFYRFFSVRSVLLAASVATFVTGIAAYGPASQSKPSTVDFNRDVRPILAQHCWPCHGQDKAALARTGGISLDSFKGATADYDGVRPIVPGKPEASVMILKVTAPEDSRMPPSDSGIKPLSAAEVEILRSWIRDGAEYRAHWAFVPPKMPNLPAVRDSKWARNEIDSFILARLEQEGLKPEPEADRRTLIRRVTLTLTGLPPTTQEVDAFLADRRPDAYERVVDRLLASHRFGENQARYWLDAVRYADTHGLHIDNERSIYPYRDWVVRAYNEDLPFDRFAVWQLAGDLLPNPTTEQKIATGYIRLNPTTNEGGAIEAEFLAKNTFDRVDTTSTVFLGVTLGCAKCHDHKYDPFSQREYYGLYAYFDSTADTPLDGNLKLHEPVMKAPTPDQAQALKSMNARLETLASKTDRAAAKSWALDAGAKLPVLSSWEASGPYLAKDFDSAYANVEPPESGGGTWRPFKLMLEQPVGIVGKENASAYLRSTVRVERQARVELRLGSDDAIKVWLNGKSIHAKKVLRGLTLNDDKVSLDLAPGENQLLIKIINASGPDAVFVGIGGPEDQRIRRASALAKASSDDPEIARCYLEFGPTSETATRYRKLLADYRTLDALVPMTYVAKELPTPRKTFVLRRGQYDLPSDPVERTIPKALGGVRAADRLGLARWIVDPVNPLTARVAVNRIWQQHFGTGIVKSSEDFGSRGDWPSHPELLDYLACRFVKDGWSIKKLTRLIVTSATYRQSAVASVAKRQKDPDNVLLSRGPRFRLDAEVIRDSALFVSGLLVDQPGGHGDKPYQPAGLWEIIAYPISDTARYRQDHGSALYRRSLYMFWKRTSPPPVMMLFDAPMRESCVVRRSRTNSPTQALATLNETGFVEAARSMAQRVLESKRTDDARIDYAFRLAVGRSATSAEAAVVKGCLADARQAYRAKPDDAQKTLSIGESPRDKSLSAPEHAAWTLVCNLILNLDETLTQH